MPALRLNLLLSLVLASALAGCGSLNRSGGAEPLALGDTQRQELIKASDDLKTDQSMSAAGTEVKRKELRDSYVANRLVLLDADFLTYLRGLTSDRRTLDSAAEGTVLGLGVLGTIKNSARTKENLAALVALVTGLKSNVDKNYYANRATDAIASMMVARRKEVMLRIVESLSASTTTYGLVSARVDLNEYYLAGTLDGAFLTIQAEAAKRDDTATRKLDNKRLVSNTMEDLSADTLKNKTALSRSLGPKANLEALQKALHALSVPADRLPPTSEESARLLQDFVRSARGKAQVDALTDVFREAGLIPR